MKNQDSQNGTVLTRRELKLKHKKEQRIAQRKQRIERKKEENHWIFCAGKLVNKYLKEDLNIQVFRGESCGTKNDESFKPLENILSNLARDKELTKRLMADNDITPPSSV